MFSAFFNRNFVEQKGVVRYIQILKGKKNAAKNTLLSNTVIQN